MNARNARSHAIPTLSHIGVPGSNPGSGIEDQAANQKVSAVSGLQSDSNLRKWWREKFPPARIPTSVYAIQMGEDGPIKIGTAQKPWERIATLQTASPYRLRGLAAWPGSVAEEAALHKHFAEDRLEGEWFKPSPELLAVVDFLGGASCEFTRPENCLGHLVMESTAMLPMACSSCGVEFS